MSIELSQTGQEQLQNIEQLLEREEQEFTIDSLWQAVSQHILAREFFIIITKLLDENKIHIETGGLISWLWNPELIKELANKKPVFRPIEVTRGISIVQIGFINSQTKDLYFKMKTGKQEEQDLIKSIDEAIEKLKQNPFLGTYIEKSKWPKVYRKYQITNLRKIDLTRAWRLIYSVVTAPDEKLVVLIEWFDHKEYERRFGY